MKTKVLLAAALLAAALPSSARAQVAKIDERVRQGLADRGLDGATNGATDGQVLTWSAAQGKWVPGDAGGGFDDQAANKVLAGPTSGGDAAPAFRALVANDIPSLAASKITSGQLAVARGGTGVDASAAANGQVLIGNGSGFALAALTGTSNQVNVSNGAGSITLSLPQSIHTGASPTFAAETLSQGTITSGGAGTAVLNLSSTWNNGGVSDFRGIYLNVTRTAGTGKLLQIDQSGTTLLDLAETGQLSVYGTIYTSAGNLTCRSGGLIGFNGLAQIYSPADSKVTLYNSSLNNFDLLQFGGGTSSFAALKCGTMAAGGVGLAAKLADDSGYAEIDAKRFDSLAASGSVAWALRHTDGTAHWYLYRWGNSDDLRFNDATSGNDVFAMRKTSATATFMLGKDSVLGWDSNASIAQNPTSDTQIKRDAAGVVGIYGASSTYGKLALASGVYDLAGSGSPEGSITANVGSVYRNTANGALYTKTNGSGNTGWSTVGGGGGYNGSTQLAITYTSTPQIVGPTGANFRISSANGSSGPGGDFLLSGGDGDSGQSGGTIDVYGGADGTNGESGGLVRCHGATTSTPGAVTISGGSGSGGNRRGADVFIGGGTKNGAGRYGVVDFQSGVSQEIVTKTSDYSAMHADHTILCDTSSTGFQVTMPDATAVPGFILVVKKISSDGNTLTVAGFSSQTMDGGTTMTTTTQWAGWMFQSNGSNWVVIGAVP